MAQELGQPQGTTKERYALRKEECFDSSNKPKADTKTKGQHTRKIYKTMKEVDQPARVKNKQCATDGQDQDGDFPFEFNSE